MDIHLQHAMVLLQNMTVYLMPNPGRILQIQIRTLVNADESHIVIVAGKEQSKDAVAGFQAIGKNFRTCELEEIFPITEAAKSPKTEASKGK